MRRKYIAISLGLLISMSASFSLCLISGMAAPMQMECSHPGTSFCSMNGEDCCLTEPGKARVKTSRESYSDRISLQRSDS